MEERNHKTMGIALIAFGALLLLVSNDIVLGWDGVWPLALLAAGYGFWRAYRPTRAPYLFVAAAATSLLGLFFLLFSTGLVDWSSMARLWPTLLVIAGGSLVAASLITGRGGVDPLLGAALLFFALTGYLFESGVISDRVSSPFIRFWPLALVLAGIVILKIRQGEGEHVETPRPVERAERVERPAPKPAAPKTATPPPRSSRSALDPEALEARILDRVKEGALSGDAVGALVRELAARFSRFSWVGVYRLRGDTLVLADGEYVGNDPEYREIPMGEGICGAAAGEGETIIVPDVCADDRYLACSPSVKSEIVVPLRASGNVVGVLDIDSDELAAFSDDDRRFLEALVSKAAPFLHAPVHPA